METVAVVVAYARSADDQRVLHVEVPYGSTVEGAIRASGLLGVCPEIELGRQKVGIFGECVPLTRLVKAGDRLEIYRPLIANPKDARRKRAQRSSGT